MIEYLRESGIKLPYIYMITKLCLLNAREDNTVQSDGKDSRLKTSDKLGIFTVGLFESLVLPLEALIQAGSSINSAIKKIKHPHA